MESAIHTLTIPPSLYAEVQALADENRRSAEDTLCEVIENGLRGLRWKNHVEHQLKEARELGLSDTAAPHVVTSSQELREKIAQGMKSLREGRGLDGEAIMAELLAGLDEPEISPAR